MELIYRKTGKGAPVMLVHGYGENQHVWDAVLKHLPKHFKYIIPDLPGYGKQEVKDPVSMELFAKYLDDILVKEKIKKAVLLGHSMGGYVTMAFAKKYPEKLKAIGLLHSHVYADSDEQIASRKKSITFIKKNGSIIYLKDFVKNLFAPPSNKKIIADHLATIIQTVPEGLTASLNAMIKRKDSSAILKSIQVPVLFLFGREDKLMPLEKMLKQCELPDQCTVEILEKSGHMGMLEETKKFGKIVGEFLNGK
jgi:pimeloyl-ACP methyl ester carboxylesterase